jgi:hypothetical protein
VAAAAVVGVRKRTWRFACYLNNENSAIAAQLGEVTATKTQQARETGVRVVWPAAGRDGGGTTTTTTAQPARAFATSPRLASAIFAPPRPQGRIGRVTRAAVCPARARKYNKRTKWSRVAPRSGRSTSRGGQNHPQKPIRPYPPRPRSRSHPPRGIDPSHQYERALTVSFPPSDVAAVPRTSRVTRQPNSAGGAQSDDPAQQSEPAGTRHAPDPRDHAVARPGAPGLSASVASISHTACTYAEDGRQGGVILVLFGNWLCLAVVCDVKSEAADLARLL